VEHRLGSSLAVSQKMEQELNASNPAAGVGTTDSDNTTTSKKTVGKAKAKRAKKAARQEIEGAEAGQQVNRETQWTKDAKKLIYHSSNALPARVRSLLGRSFSTISKN
jgi:hypothetical protein